MAPFLMVPYVEAQLHAVLLTAVPSQATLLLAAQQ